MVMNSTTRRVFAVVAAIAVVAIARYVETRLGVDPDHYWLPNLAGGVLAAVVVLAGPEWAQTASAVAATVATVAALSLSWSALELARSNEVRLDRQDDQRFAEMIHIGEPPASVYVARSREDCAAALASEQADCHPRQDDRVWLVVINPGGVQIENVFVRGEDPDSGAPRDEFVRIGGLERCSMYYLPHWVSDTPARESPDDPIQGAVEFHPGELFFTDPVGHWRRAVGGQVEPVQRAEWERIQQELTDQDNGISPYTDMLPNCAG